MADQTRIMQRYLRTLQGRRVKDYDFSWERILRAEGDTGPYLQYTHARLASIERGATVTLSEMPDLSLLRVRRM